MSFNDLVNTTSLDPTKITFQQSKLDLLQLDLTNSYSLTGGSTNSSPGFIIFIFLIFLDINELKLRPRLANNNNDTFISITAATIDDENARNIFAIPPIEAIAASYVRPDITPPRLDAFTFNLNTELVILTFSEVINLDTLDITQFSIIPFPFANTSSQISLTGTSVFGNLYTRIFNLDLSMTDVNNIKLTTTLATSSINTYCIISSSFISDVSGISVSPITFENPINVSIYIPDKTSPNLLSFIFDMDEGTIYLSFDEIINASTFDFSSINISTLNGNLVYSITAGNFINKVSAETYYVKVCK